jgi:hypothetical protein
MFELVADSEASLVQEPLQYPRLAVFNRQLGETDLDPTLTFWFLDAVQRGLKFGEGCVGAVGYEDGLDR